jgi:COP9 signalosome complex subunit 4
MQNLRILFSNKYKVTSLFVHLFILKFYKVSFTFTNRQYQSDFKLKTYCKIAELYLQEADSQQAEINLSRAAVLEKDTKDLHLHVKYKAAQSRIWDFKRKFVEAASKYYELSLNTLITESEKMEALNNAMNCTVLASAGKQRTRLLATLFKDERSQKLPAYGIFEKMYLERIIRSHQAKEFETMLQPHQKAITTDGNTNQHFSTFYCST